MDVRRARRGEHRPERQAGRLLPALPLPGAIAAGAAGFFLPVDGDEAVPVVAVVNRAVGGSFVVSGLVAWQRRPHNRVGALMTLTASLSLAQALLGELDGDLAWTLAEVLSNWWLAPFAALVFG